jgi:hypothetical protein
MISYGSAKSVLAIVTASEGLAGCYRVCIHAGEAAAIGQEVYRNNQRKSSRNECDGLAENKSGKPSSSRPPVMDLSEFAGTADW